MRCVAHIGIGRWGQNLMRSFAQECRIKYIASEGNPSNFVQAKKIQPKIKLVSVEEILDDPEVEAVIVATPVEVLGEVASRIVSAGKHIFLEKPGATTSVQLDNLVALRRVEQICYVNYLYLVDPCYLSFRRAVNGTNLRNLRFTWKKFGTFGNDLLLNLASHELAQAIDILGEVPRPIDRIISENNCLIVLKRGDTNIHIDIDRQSKNRFKSITAATDEGTFCWSPGQFSHDSFSIETGSSEDLVGASRDVFLENVRNGTKFSNLELASRVLNVIQEIRQ